MICSKRMVCASEERFHLADVGGFGVDELLGQIFDLAVIFFPMVHILQPLDHTSCVTQNHHVCNFGVRMAVAQLHPGCHIGHEPDTGIQFRQFPAPLGGQRMGLTFNGIELFQLRLQGLLEAGAHDFILNTADAHLTHLGRFQNGRKDFLIGFHIHHPFQYALR